MFLDSHVYAKCCGCGACVDACPNRAITMSELHNGFIYPQIDQSLCINCGKCRKICAFDSPDDVKGIDKCYYGWHKDSSVRMASTSGGAFMALAEGFCNIHKEDGVYVYGVAWSSVTEAKHICVEKSIDLSQLQRSKYIQSNTNQSFSDIKNQLKAGAYVLFSGTPCQVAALKRYLKDDNQEKLITVDIICNGVASPEVFKDYIVALERKYNKKVLEYSFRNKNIQKKSQKYIRITFDDNSELLTEMDDYYLAYQYRLLHRESCFNCPYSENTHCADITIGDFWHIEEVVTALKPERIKGISMLLSNTEKGLRLVRDLNNMELIETDYRPKAARLSESMKDPDMLHFYEDYDKNVVLKQLRGYIGTKRLLMCKYPQVFVSYYNLRHVISRIIKRG